MNPASQKSNVSPHQNIATSLEAKGKDKGTGSTEKPLEGISGGRSVSPATYDNTLAVVSAGQVAGTTEAAEATLLPCREAAQSAASAMPIDKTGSTQAQLSHELGKLEITNESEKSGGMTKALTGHQMMRLKLTQANELIAECKFEKAKEALDHVFVYATTHGDEDLEAYAHRSTGFLLFSQGKEKKALSNFIEASRLGGPLCELTESILIQNMSLAMGIDKKEEEEVFQPETFYEEIKLWTPTTDDAREEALEERITKELEKETQQQMKMLREGLKEIFVGEDNTPNTEKIESIIEKLTRFEMQSKSTSTHAADMLRFTRDLRLVERGRYQEALENVTRIKDGGYEFNYLGKYIYCQVFRKTGNIDEAIRVCEEHLIDDHYPFWNYLSELHLDQLAGPETLYAPTYGED